MVQTQTLSKNPPCRSHHPKSTHHITSSPASSSSSASSIKYVQTHVVKSATISALRQLPFTLRGLRRLPVYCSPDRLSSPINMARLWLLLLASLLAAAGSDAAGIGFEFHHRFSDRVRQWAEARAVPGASWPQKGTAEYYAALAHHDRALRGRSLADASASELTFADGNATYFWDSDGDPRVSSPLVWIGSGISLHYAFVELGTPNVTFLVALDTGSDLFWVPCDCQQCASTHLGITQLPMDCSDWEWRRWQSPAFYQAKDSLLIPSQCALERMVLGESILETKAAQISKKLRSSSTADSEAPRSKNCAALARHDRALRGRLLADGDATYLLSSLGF
ncbi:hypothetical protein B296_00029627 [Ensete ventricosum]|uniref:Peptidase A1 domain-containing protein n=1 Tax=Ensete ventricosum TaxID=4639 RepID=A0A427AG69_ENSVE|nr:hypothetical protein B296_00029627 [Ensete ventricosum]